MYIETKRIPFVVEKDPIIITIRDHSKNSVVSTNKYFLTQTFLGKQKGPRCQKVERGAFDLYPLMRSWSCDQVINNSREQGSKNTIQDKKGLVRILLWRYPGHTTFHIIIRLG